jgi:NAD(P)-dependent dehydrogenase (short-subunit alcohol dehydrogenase family)
MRIFLTGASAGIGLLAARALCERGHQVWGTARKAENLPVMENFHPIPMDLNNRDSIRIGFDQALGEAGRLDVLINNAGNSIFGPLESFSDEELRAQMDVLLFGPLDLIRMVLPSMRAANKGLIVNVASLAAEFPLPFMAPYTVGKAALGSLTEGLGMELAHTGIRLVDLRPGDFATSFHLSTRRVESPLNAAYQPNLDRAWKTIDHNMAVAPDPQMVADALVKIVEGQTRRPVVAVGDFFQARIAPFLARLAPRGWVQWGLRMYYGLKKS